ncbi:hypothetical protein AKI39_11170 [Bordetella sp. H567]|uniref:hypothetical protein n=1 Tax=Bordetella sp. H567 TaxID=1697043 RepID=UPI00081CE083|nr:hypothetical protein [Bordetella sp. H567]AOB31141.1 hypothetical protein AKI39_11170 [Bordetella sp. H567]
MIISVSPSAALPPSFAPAFFTPYTPAPETPVRTAADEGRPRMSYWADRHGSHAAFCASPDFEQYRQEVADDVRFLTGLARDLGMVDADMVEENLRVLYEHRFNVNHFDTHAELFDSAGKRSLDNVCDMLRDERLPQDKRRNAIRELALGVTLCASGAVANLMAADRELSLSTGGMRSKLWKMKEDVVRSVLHQAVLEQFGANPNYPGDEVHYFSGVWNYVADAVGLNEIEDLMVPRLPLDFLNACQKKVFAAISPDKLARLMATECLEGFRSRTIDNAHPASGVCTAAATERFTEVLNDIRQELGLEEDALSMHSFVRIDGDGLRYDVRTDCGLIAVELLKAMNADKLLEDAPRQLGERVEADGTHIGLYSYGDRLAWRLRQAMDGAAPWFAQGDLETIDFADLHALPGAQAPDAPTLPAGVIREILRKGNPADLMGVRANWLGTSRSILALLNRLDADQAIQYLDANMPYLRTGFPESERASFLSDAITMGEPGRQLARAWYPDPWALLGEKPREYTSVTQLERWLMANQAAPIDTVREMIVAGWQNGHDAVSLRDAMLKALTGIEGRSLMWVPVHTKTPAGTDALHRLVVDLLNEPASGPAMAQALPKLLSGTNSHIQVLDMLDPGNAAALSAVHRMLFDPAILPLIQNDMPHILLGGQPQKEVPMWSALYTRDVPLIRAYGALLADVAKVPGMEKWLAILTTPNKSAGSPEPGGRLTDSVLLHVSVAVGVEVIKAYHDILVHPAILLHIQGMLPELLGPTEADDFRRPGYLTASLLSENLGGYTAYREMITDPRILPHILQGLPRMQLLMLVQAGIVEAPVEPVHALPASLPTFLQLLQDRQS